MLRPKWALAAVALALAAATAVRFYPPGRLLAIKAVGRSPECSLAAALSADRNASEQVRLKDRILASSRVIETDSAGFQHVETPSGRYWIPQGDAYVLPWNLAEQARDVYGSLGPDGVRKGDIALDCGANVGAWTRVALDRGAAMVVAFEPAPENIEAYRRNYKDEIAAGRVILMPKGVWDKEDVLTLHRDPNNTAANSFVMAGNWSQSVEAPLTTIDQAVSELKLPRVDYIKMDVEGAETRALAGATRTIAAYHPRLAIAAEHKPDDAVEIPRAVRAISSAYRMSCGPCLETSNGRIRPDTLIFK